MSSEKDSAGAPPGAEAPAEILERWSAQRKTELVVRLLRGEPLDAVARDSQVPAHELEEWRRVFLDGGTQSLKKRLDPEDRELKRVRAKLGEVMMRLDLADRLGKPALASSDLHRSSCVPRLRHSHRSTDLTNFGFAAPYSRLIGGRKTLQGSTMWNREQSSGDSGGELSVQPTGVSAAPDPRFAALATASSANLGRSVSVNGELTGSEDLTVNGRVEGRIDLPDHVLTIGPNGSLHARLAARIVTVFGSVVGTITAHDTIHIRKGASVEGDLVCARLAIQDGAHFRGKVEMAPRGQTRNERHAEAATPLLAEVG